MCACVRVCVCVRVSVSVFVTALVSTMSPFRAKVRYQQKVLDVGNKMISLLSNEPVRAIMYTN